MKRVLVFSLAYFPHVGGAEIAVKEITDRIPDIDFSLITLRMRGEAREERIGRVRVHRIGNGVSYLQKVLFIPRAALYAARLHRTQPFDAFWCMMSYMLFPIVLLRALGIRIPYLLTLQEGDPFRHVFGRLRILPFRPLLAYGFRHAASVQTISTYLALWAVKAGYSGTPQVISNGVDIKYFSQAFPETELDALAHVIGKRDGETLLITTSRLTKKNACDDVIRALTRLPRNVLFLILGTGPDEYALRELAKQLGVLGRIRFIGHVTHEELPKYLRISDIFIRPSRSEGMGNSFIEAMAAGIPVIATQEGGIADFLFDAKRNPERRATGWAVDRDSPEQIAAAVKEILDDPEQVKKVTAHAREFVRENYDWNTIALRMEKEVFNRIVT